MLTNFSLKKAFQKTDASERMMKWAVELNEFDIVYKIRVVAKDQALAHFVAEFANIPEMEEEMESSEPPTWNQFVDGYSRKIGSGVGVVLVSQKYKSLIVQYGLGSRLPIMQQNTRPF